jgi:hypothetical protein
MLPESGSVSAINEWTMTGLPDGVYTWTLRAVDSAYNGGPTAEAVFTIDVPTTTVVFSDNFESGDLSRWSGASP